MAGIYDTCAGCGTSMTHPTGRGKARKYCGSECQGRADAARKAAKACAPCCVDRCTNAATRVGAVMCETHYYRARRNGTTEFIGGATPGNLQHSGGYLLQPAKNHPRALGKYRAYEHRVVFYDAHGEGPFECHCCGKKVTWQDMHVDHLDDDPTNNVTANLSAACAVCNQQRGHHKIMRGWRYRTGLTIGGERLTLNEWAAKVGAVTRATIVDRLSRGWTAEEAVTTPARKFPKSMQPLVGGSHG